MMSVNKRKEIYKYDAPWPLYSMNWSVRPDKRFRFVYIFFLTTLHNFKTQLKMNFYDIDWL